MISVAFVFFRVRTANVFLGDLSLDGVALSFRSVEPCTKPMGKMELLGVGISFARVSFAEFAFVPLAGAFPEAYALGAFARVTVLCEHVIVGDLRCVLPGVVVSFVILDAATSNPGVTDGATSAAVFTSGPFACDFEILMLHSHAFAA